MRFLLVVLLCALSFSSCDNVQESGGRSAIDRYNEKVAGEAVHLMKNPLDQAKAAGEKEHDHNKQMEYQLKMQ